MVNNDRVAQVQQQWQREHPEIDASPLAITGRTRRISERLREELLISCQEVGLGEGEFDVLSSLRRAGAPFELGPSQLAEHTLVTAGATTKRLDRLEARGLVVRRNSESDGRGRVVALTAEGHRIIDRGYARHMQIQERFLAVFSSAERQQLEDLLTRWSDAVEG